MAGFILEPARHTPNGPSTAHLASLTHLESMSCLAPPPSSPDPRSSLNFSGSPGSPTLSTLTSSPPPAASRVCLDFKSRAKSINRTVLQLAILPAFPSSPPPFPEARLPGLSPNPRGRVVVTAIDRWPSPDSEQQRPLGDFTDKDREEDRCGCGCGSVLSRGPPPRFLQTLFLD